MAWPWLKPVAFSALPLIGGFGGAYSYGMRNAKVKNWYDNELVKPWWRPPKWAFGPVWTGLYLSMGYASYIVYQDGGGFDGEARVPLALYGVQLALNWAWTPIFFGAKKLGLATVETVALWSSIVACAYSFHGVNPTAGYIMLPYIGWASLATCLTIWIWRHNRDVKQD